MSSKAQARASTGASIGDLLGGMADKVRDMVARGLMALAVAVTVPGVAIITNRILQAGTAAKYIGWGTGTGAAATSDSALGTETAPTTSGGRTAGTESRVTTTNTNDTVQVTGTVTATLTGPTAITEMGLFDAATAGGLLLRAVYSAINTSVGDSINYTAGVKYVPSVV